MANRWVCTISHTVIERDRTFPERTIKARPYPFICSTRGPCHSFPKFRKRVRRWYFSLSHPIDARSMLPNRKISPPESFSPKVKKKIDKCSSSGKRAKLSKKIEKYEEMRGEGRMMCNAGSIHPKPERVYERVENRENEKKREKGGRNVSAIHSLGLVSPTLATALIKRVINIRPAVTGGRDIILRRLPFRHQSESVTRPTRRRGLLSNRVDRSFRS